MNATLLHGDCLEQLRTLPDNSVDAVVTDPPYGLAFMGKRWDYDVPSSDIWAECLRVLKPGGHLLAFAGTRTQHRMAVRIEDAGFEIRDMIAWVYASGFPKSLDVSKAIDKVNGETNRLHRFTAWMRTTGVTASQVNTATGTFMGSHYLTAGSQPAIPTPELWTKLRPLCGEVPEWVDKLVERIAAEREVVGQKEMTDTTKARAGFSGPTHSPDYDGTKRLVDITAPATDAAKQWDGWGTALKPALEPITVARKPLCGTVAENVQQHGTGALNVDGCRVEGKPRTTHADGNYTGNSSASAIFPMANIKTTEPLGRWPANLIHDGSEEVVGLLGDAARFFYCAKASKADRDDGCGELEKKNNMRVNGPRESEEEKHATKLGNHHPTVKPTDLMRYLCRLVTPPGGVVLDPFMGSGSTGKAAILEGFRFIGCEREAEYVEIARARITAAESERAQELPLGD